MKVLVILAHPEPLSFNGAMFRTAVPASFVLGLCQFLAIPFTSIWVIAVGVRLYRYGSRLQVSAVHSL